jgi:hypothetical protein
VKIQKKIIQHNLPEVCHLTEYMSTLHAYGKQLSGFFYAHIVWWYYQE